MSRGIYDSVNKIRIPIAGAQVPNVDNNIIYNSPNPVAGGAVYNETSNIYNAMNNISNSFIYDSIPTENSSNMVNSGVVYSALNNKQNVLQYDLTPTVGSSNILNSGSIYNETSNIYNAINNVSVDLNYDSIPTQNSNNLVNSGVIYTTVNQLQLNFQAGCDSIVGTLTAKGVTPTINSPNEISNAINKLIMLPTSNYLEFVNTYNDDYLKYMTYSMDDGNIYISAITFTNNLTPNIINIPDKIGNKNVIFSSLLLNYSNSKRPSLIFNIYGNYGFIDQKNVNIYAASYTQYPILQLPNGIENVQCFGNRYYSTYNWLVLYQPNRIIFPSTVKSLYNFIYINDSIPNLGNINFGIFPDSIENISNIMICPAINNNIEINLNDALIDNTLFLPNSVKNSAYMFGLNHSLISIGQSQNINIYIGGTDNSYCMFYSMYVNSDNNTVHISMGDNVSNCSYMFNGFRISTNGAFECIIGNNVTNCSHMFENFYFLSSSYRRLTPLRISDSVIDCSYMLNNTFNKNYGLFSTVTLGNNVINCKGMFMNLNYQNDNIPIIIPDSVQDCSYMFSETLGLYPVFSSNANVTNMSYMFSSNNNSFHQYLLDKDNIFIPNKVTNISSMFYCRNANLSSRSIYINSKSVLEAQYFIAGNVCSNVNFIIDIKGNAQSFLFFYKVYNCNYTILNTPSDSNSIFTNRNNMINCNIFVDYNVSELHNITGQYSSSSYVGNVKNINIYIYNQNININSLMGVYLRPGATSAYDTEGIRIYLNKNYNVNKLNYIIYSFNNGNNVIFLNSGNYYYCSITNHMSKIRIYRTL